MVLEVIAHSLLAALFWGCGMVKMELWSRAAVLMVPRKQRREDTKGLEPDTPFERPLPMTHFLQWAPLLNCLLNQLMNPLTKLAP